MNKKLSKCLKHSAITAGSSGIILSSVEAGTLTSTLSALTLMATMGYFCINMDQITRYSNKLCLEETRRASEKKADQENIVETEQNTATY